MALRLRKVADHVLQYTRTHAEHSAQCSVLFRYVEALLERDRDTLKEDIKQEGSINNPC